MIYYATKETLQRYKLKTPEQFESEMAPFVRAVVNRERGNRLFEWGCKLFYFDRRKTAWQYLRQKTDLLYRSTCNCRSKSV